MFINFQQLLSRVRPTRTVGVLLVRHMAFTNPHIALTTPPTPRQISSSPTSRHINSPTPRHISSPPTPLHISRRLTPCHISSSSRLVIAVPTAVHRAAVSNSLLPAASQSSPSKVRASLSTHPLR